MINEKGVMTLPYADDFCLITTNMRAHKRLIAEIHSHINSIRMSLKPSKRRYFSILKGKPTVVNFALVIILFRLIYMKNQKFLEKL